MVLLVSSCAFLGDGGDGGPAAAATADAYLTAWANGDVAAMSALVTDPPADFTTVQQQFRTGLQVVTAEVSAVDVATSGDTGTASFRAELGLQGIGTWGYDGALDLRRGRR